MQLIPESSDLADYLKELDVVDFLHPLDARGNKPGVQAEFSVNEEILVFPIREEFDEKDYPIIYTNPNQKTITTRRKYGCIKMYIHHLPDAL